MQNADLSLAEAARDAAKNAYAPYSGFAVGAAVRTKSGRIYIGANLENASYGMTMCAEVAAITAANSAGDYEVESIAVVGYKFSDPASYGGVCTPCGRCRQLICEASQISREDVKVLSCNGDLSQIETNRISELLPSAFGPSNLGIVETWPVMRQSLKERSEALRRPDSLPVRAAE